MSKDAFRAYCEKHPELPLSLQYDWISGIAPDTNWGVCFAGDPSDPKGYLVYFIKRKYGFRKITIPPLTPYLGPWIIYPPEQKRSQRYGYEKKVMDELIEGLPPHDDLTLHFHPEVTNWLPFYWKGFRETLRYTYQLPEGKDPGTLFDGLRGNIRRAIRKAEKQLEIVPSDGIDALHDIKLRDYRDKGIPMSYDRSYFHRIDSILAPKGQRELLYAVDEKGNTHGGIYLTMDRNICYYLIGAVEPSLKNDGAMPLLMWKAIEKAASRGLRFDFEGSMIEPIERFFRSFGAEQVPYHHVSKTPSVLLRGKQALSILRGN
jgi:hypothetical protein